MQAPPTRPQSRLAASEAALVLVADILVVLVLQRQQVLEATGIALGWWPLVIPAMLACAAASLAARNRGLTALPFGPNAVVVMAFSGVLGPVARRMCASAAPEERAVELAGFFGASLGLYGLMVAVLTLLVLRLNLQNYRRVLLMPLAAICWTYLVAVPALRLPSEPIALALPAVALFALLVAGVRSFVPWLVSGALWLVLAWATGVFPSASAGVTGGFAPFAWRSAGARLGDGAFWLEVLPIVAPLAIANAFGIIENIAAAREVGDPVSPGHTLAIVTAGTAAAAALGTSAPMTVYVGHAAFQRRGAGWSYGLWALPMLAVVGTFGDGLVERLPIPVFLGAIAYLGATIGFLPRHHLRGGADVARFLAVVTPVAVLGLLGSANPVLAWLGRGGGLTSVGWAFLGFAPRYSLAREAAAWALAAASVLGLVHAQPFTWPGAVTATAYAGIAITLRVRARALREVGAART